MITKFKIFESNFGSSDVYITWNSKNKKSPKGYKYQLGDYVKVKNPTYYRWKIAGYNSDTFCIVCIVNAVPYNDYRYVVVPIESPDSSYEEWVTEDEIEPLEEYKVSTIKYNL